MLRSIFPEMMDRPSGQLLVVHLFAGVTMVTLKLKYQFHTESIQQESRARKYATLIPHVYDCVNLKRNQKLKKQKKPIEDSFSEKTTMVINFEIKRTLPSTQPIFTVHRHGDMNMSES